MTFAFAAAATAGVLLSAGDDLGDWPSYNRDVLGWRFNSAEKTLDKKGAANLEEKWRFPPKGADYEIGVVHATPIVVDGFVYFGTASDPAFFALNPDGSLKWAYRNPELAGKKPVPILAPTDPATKLTKFQSSPSGILGSALVVGDAVYFGDIGGWFYCLDRATGKERWKISAKAGRFPDTHPLSSFFSSPIFADGKIIVGGGTLEQVVSSFIPLYPANTGRGFVVAFDPKTGKIAWKHDVGPRPKRFSTPVVVADGWGPRTFTNGPATSSIWSTPSFDAETGTIFFGTDVNTAPRQPTKEDPTLSTPESCAIAAISVRDGKTKWYTQVNPGDVWTNAMRSWDPATERYKDQSIGDTPKILTVTFDGVVERVVGAGCKNGGFYLLRVSDGKILRHTPVYAGPPQHPLSPPADPRTLALPSCIGGLQSGCATDGKSIFTNGIDAIRLGAMERPDQSCVAATGGRVCSLTTDLSKERWRHERPLVPSVGGPPPKLVLNNVGDPVASGIALANGVAYFTGVASGKLVAVDADTGSLLKEIHLGPMWCGPSVSRGRVYVGTGNTLFNDIPEECFLPKKNTGSVHCFGPAD